MHYVAHALIETPTNASLQYESSNKLLVEEQRSIADSPRVNLLKISLYNVAPSTVQEQEKLKG